MRVDTTHDGVGSSGSVTGTVTMPSIPPRMTCQARWSRPLPRAVRASSATTPEGTPRNSTGICARPARSSPSRTSTTGESASRATTMATDTISPMNRARVVSSGEKTTAAIGPHTAARRAPTATDSGALGTRLRCGCRTPSSALPSWGDRNGGRPNCRIRAPGLRPPRRRRADLTAAEAVRLEPGRRALVGTGVRIALPEGTPLRGPAQRAGREARHHHRQRPRHDRRRVPRRDQGRPAEHRPRRGLRHRGRRPHRPAHRDARPARALRPRRRTPRQRARRRRFRIERIPEPARSTR